MAYQTPRLLTEPAADPAAPAHAAPLLTDSELGALEEHRRARQERESAESEEALARAQAELLTEQENRAAERRLVDAHIEQLIRQVAELTVAKRESDRAFRAARTELDEVKRELRDNTVITEEIRDLLAAVKGGFKVLGWLGTAAKWAGGLAAAFLALSKLWLWFKNGGTPPWK